MQVEIIGDAYFAVGGVPTEMEDHAERCAAAAVDMQAVMPLLSQMARADIQMRAGLHTGAVTAGVVGLMNPRYHLFGPTVARAARMEQMGAVGT